MTVPPDTSGPSPDAPSTATSADVDPRVGRSRALIIDATLDELAAVGYGALTIEGIAKRAGVGKATVYRHWDGKLELLSDAITQLKQMELPSPDADVWDQVVGVVRALANHLASSRLAACLPAIIDAAERDEAVRRFHQQSSEQRRRHLAGLLERAQAEGRLVPDVDAAMLAQCLVGPIFLRRLMTADVFPPDEVDDLIETVLGPYVRR